jgi:hypothetical protein
MEVRAPTLRRAAGNGCACAAQVADFMAAGGGARLGDMQHGWTLLHRFVIDRKYARPSPPLGLDCGERTRRVHLSR